MFVAWLLLSVSAVSHLDARASLSEKVLLKDRIKGAIQGAALGDAFGRITTKFDNRQEILNAYGDKGLTSLNQCKASDWRYDAAGKKYAPWTDNTLFSNALFTAFLEGRKRKLTTIQYGDVAARSLLALTSFAPQDALVQDNMRNRRLETMHAAERLAQLVENKTEPDWWVRHIPVDCRDTEIGDEIGSSVLARVWPAGIVYVDDIRKAQTVARAVAEVTHRNPTAVAATAALVAGVAYAVRGVSVDDVVNQMARAASCYNRLEQTYKRHALKCTPCGGSDRELIANDKMLTGDMVRYAAFMARSGALPEDVLGDASKKTDNNRSPRGYLLGHVADEAVAAAVYIFVRHPNDLKGALAEAALCPGQADLIGSLAGALVGAHVGYNSFERALSSETALLEENGALLALADSISDGVNECIAQEDEVKSAPEATAEIAPKKVCTPLCKVLLGATGVAVIGIAGYLIWKYVIN